MNRDVPRTVLTASLLAFFTAWGAVGCVHSAFSLSLQRPHVLILVCGLSAWGSAIMLSFRHGGTGLLCLMALCAGYIHHAGTALLQLRQLIARLSIIYDRAYGWGSLPFSSELPQAAFADWPLRIWGSLMAAAVCRSVCRQKSVWLPALVTVLPLCSCIVVTDTVPRESFLLMVLAGLLLLMLTSSVRQDHAAQGNRLTAAAALPVLLALSGLFLAFPQNSYVNHSALLRENILTAVRHLPQLLETGMGELTSGLQSQPSCQVDLASLGDRIPFTYPVMEVTAEISGPLYLREQDYDLYDGRGWQTSENREESFSSAAGQAETVRIRTKTKKAVRYLPYHPALPASLSGGSAGNPQKEQDYTVLRHRLPENWRQTAYESNSASPVQWQTYLTLPESTRLGAVEFLEPLYKESLSNTAKADIIAALVTDSARYDTRPGKMPAGETDFALWFLRDSDSGYCVHFATAATVLLRAAGIPARYVTGYLLDAQAGESVTVTEENAHAWAEYYEPGLGVWLPLEATPAEQAAVLPQPTEEASEETTVPAETTSPETSPATEGTTPGEDPLPQTTPPAEIPQETPAEHLPLISLLLFLPAVAGLMALQRSLRLRIRRKYQHKGTPNQQALRRWQESLRLSRLLKESPTEELIVLAQKAKFSQYELTAEELQHFDSFQRSCLRRLKERPRYLQLIYKYVYAAY